MSGRTGARGFTLIELLVALVIFLLFMGAIYGTFTAGQRSMVMAEEQEDLYQAGRVLMAQLQAELASAYQYPGATTSSLLGEDTEGVSDGAQEDRLTLLTTAHDPFGEQVAGDLCRVTYAMNDPATDEPSGLYVEESFTPDLEVDDVAPQRRLLSPLVVGFNCKYLPVEGDWVTEWVDQTTLPVAVRIELVLQSKQAGAKPLVLVSTTNLAMATLPAEGGGNANP